MILIVDHYDSFVDMIADYCAQLGFNSRIIKTDQITPVLISKYKPSHIILGPGPGHPDDADLKAVHALITTAINSHTPLLGICLGQQIIATYFKAKVIKAARIAHGIISEIAHEADELFLNLPPKFKVTRYHSLLVDPISIKDTPLKVTANTEFAEIMALRHPFLAVYGVQFHPESVTTEFGLELLANFLNTASIST